MDSKESCGQRRGMLPPTFFGWNVLHTISNFLQLFHIVVDDFPLESLGVSEAKDYRISTLPCLVLWCHWLLLIGGIIKSLISNVFALLLVLAIPFSLSLAIFFPLLKEFLYNINIYFLFHDLLWTHLLLPDAVNLKLILNDWAL